MTSIEIGSNMRTRIIDKVVRVLYKSHSHSYKRECLEGRDRLNFACPYCGDSTTDDRKKRGNLYWNDLYFHCYNCGTHKSLDDFLKDFDNNFEGDDRISIINYIKQNRKNIHYGQSLNFYLFDKIETLSISFDELAAAFNIYRINEATYRVYPYLKSRLLHNKLNRFGYDPRRKELYVFNLDTAGKIIGFQIRQLDNTGGPKYRTWNLERIYDKLGLDLAVDPNELEDLNKISMIFGILQSDLSKPFTVFEGPMDSFFMFNSIGLTGVKKQVIDFDDVPTVRYFFDNDIEGKRRMIDKLKQKQTVFMWSKFINDFNIPSKKVKDLNDLVKYEYKNRIGCLSNLDKYFTNDPLDIIFI